MLRIAPNLCGTSYIITVSVCQSVSIRESDSSSHSRLHLPTYVSGFWGLLKDSSDPCIEHPNVTYGTDNGKCSISVLYCVVGAGGNLCLAAKAPTIHCDILLRATEYIKNCDSGPAVGAEEASAMFWTSGGNYKPNPLLITSLRGWFCGARRRDQKGNSLIDMSWDIS